MPYVHRLPLLLVAMSLGACGRTKSPGSSGNEAADTAASEIAVADFVGSATCRGCHQAEYEDWMGSHHEQAMQVANDDTVLGDFDGAVFDYFGTTTRFFMRDGDYYVDTADAFGEQREFRIAYTFGIEPLQQYLVEFPGGRLQALAFSWDTRPAAEGGQRWFHQFPDEYIAPDDELHWTGMQQNWNYMCAECHSTNVEMGYDATASTFTTTYSEISVGCESCHGPGSTHIDRVNGGTGGGDYGLAVDLDDQDAASWVMNPETGIAERSPPRMRPQQQPEACGRCHSRRGIIAPEYEYGEPLAHTHMPALLNEGLYFADGQILDEVYVYGSFLQSRMYQAGVTCSDCHDPHSANLVTGANPNDVCTQCHLPTTFAVEDHAGHVPEQAGCVDCHMPDRTYMVVDDRRDHSFRVPRPDLAISTGAPNTCAGCHDDREAAWAAAAVDRWRGTGAEPRLQFATAIHAGRQGFANDQLRAVIDNPEHPGIARATAMSLLAAPFGSADFRALESGLGNADPLLRIAALREVRNLPAELRLRLPGASLLADPVRSVRIEAALTYAGTRDLLPLGEARAYASAEREYREAYRAIANRPEALVSLANFETSEGNNAAAIELYEQALALEPRAVTARVNLADVLRARGDETRAQSVLRQGLDLDDANAALQHALGLSLVRSRQTEEALQRLRRAAELAPDNARYTYVFAIALNSTGQQQQALGLLNDAREMFPTDFDIAMALATMRRDAGDIDGALNIGHELARRHPDEPSVRGLLRSLDAAP